ncbi:MAG: peptidase prolyl oligopeptidase active site domain protein [Gemmatimonadetes bacterium]|nr:peptidase prolyl oligopeptidase active site domain protein [Gemmatimonadota bacterium]
MSRSVRLLLGLAVAHACASGTAIAQRTGYSLEQIKSYPFPGELATAASGTHLAWTLNERGLRNIWVADDAGATPRRLTAYLRDDGQEITSVSLTADGRRVLYVRGGDHGANWDGPSPNPASLPVAHKVELWTIPFAGGTPVRIGEGDDPEVSPRGDVVAFVKDRAIWTAPVDGSVAPTRLFTANGASTSPRWSPDGTRLAFVSQRGDHSFIGVYTNDSTPIRWLAPSTSRDASPRWKPDGSRIAFVRRPGSGGAPDSALVEQPNPWAIWLADPATGAAWERWRSPATARGSVPGTHGGTNLQYAAAGRVVFVSELDGWPHLYSMPDTGGAVLALTPGRFMVEHLTMNAAGTLLAFAGNAGSDADDIDRRHVVVVRTDRAEPRVVTAGSGLEWSPAFVGDGTSLGFIGATAQRPPLPAVMPLTGTLGSARWLGNDRIPAEFPTAQLVTPRRVLFRAADGLEIHGQLFERPGDSTLARNGRKPAIIYVHGGPPRQMLLGWNYSDYYANSYAMNQYLASLGYVVLSVNYRLGIGYGRDFQHPSAGGARGASEYQDVVAGARYLRGLAQVDTSRIGIYGGSYGGFLTALALGRNSDLFAAGVDIHGVHDWTAERARGLLAPDQYEKAPDQKQALETAWRASPVASISRWRSPVLLIHGDDDRNVRFSQTVDLARRLSAAGVEHAELVIPDETHHLMRWANSVRVNQAVADYFDAKLARRSVRVTGGVGARR